MSQDATNRRLYQRPELVRDYARKTALYPAELAMFARYGDELRDRAVLELGCGAGRLIAHLAPVVRRYVGIDVSPHMIAHCREHFPDAELAVRDMRDLDYAEGSFHVVVAIANLLDAIDHDDRLRVLSAIRRVLAAGGLCVFSSHNRQWDGFGTPPQLELTPHPLALLKRGAQYARARVRKRRARASEQRTPDYAILTDEGHDFGVLHYYIERKTQARQLADLGFELLAVFDTAGVALEEDADDCASPSLLYVARRA